METSGRLGALFPKPKATNEANTVRQVILNRGIHHFWF
jgi:hypothetical protein